MDSAFWGDPHHYGPLVTGKALAVALRDMCQGS